MRTTLHIPLLVLYCFLREPLLLLFFPTNPEAYGYWRLDPVSFHNHSSRFGRNTVTNLIAIGGYGVVVAIPSLLLLFRSMATTVDSVGENPRHVIHGRWIVEIVFRIEEQVQGAAQMERVLQKQSVAVRPFV